MHQDDIEGNEIAVPKRRGSPAVGIMCMIFAVLFVFTFSLGIRQLRERHLHAIDAKPITATIAKVIELPYHVRKIVDGDTLILSDGQDVEFKVRLEGIDAPESVQPFGIDARNKLASIVASGSVKLESKRTDKYGRHLGSIYNQIGYVNLILVQTGYAWAYGSEGQRPEIAAAQAHARQPRLGLWSSSNPIAPWDWRSGIR